MTENVWDMEGSNKISGDEDYNIRKKKTGMGQIGKQIARWSI